MATFRRLPSGKWQARVSKDGEEFSVGTFRTKKEAEIEANKVEERIYYGQVLNDRQILFEDVVDEWYEHKIRELKDSTARQLEVSVRLHIKPAFAGKKIMKVTRKDVKNWIRGYVDSLDENGEPNYSEGSCLKYLSQMKSVFHFAVHEMEILEKNPTDKLRVPVKDSTKKIEEVKFLTLDELEQLLDFMRSYRHHRFNKYRLYYTLMFFLSRTGLRISEALALRWTDIVGNQLNVERQASRDDNNKLVITTLKNTSSYRTIGLDKYLLEELDAFKKVQDELIAEGAREHGFIANEDGIIFQNPMGNYLTPSTVRVTIKEYCEKAKVGYKGTHGFRHTHAVLLLESGASLFFVSKRLGHKTIKTTADTYLSITKKIEEDELEKFALYTKPKSKSA